MPHFPKFILLLFAVTVLTLVLALENSVAYAAEQPGMSDFKMGMTKQEVAAILDKQYNMEFTTQPPFGAFFKPTNENPYGWLAQDFFDNLILGSRKYPGLEIHGCKVKNWGASGLMTFIFAHDKLIQCHLQLSDVEQQEIIAILQQKYGGELVTLGQEGIRKHVWYMAETNEFDIFVDDADKPEKKNNVIRYSAKNACETIQAIMAADEAAKGNIQKQKADETAHKL
jgi:hypothetical protein